MASFHVIAGAQEDIAQPEVREIGAADILDALRRGVDDFSYRPSHYVFLCLIYPVVGALLIAWASTGNALQLIYPLVAGFALLGPIAGIGLYEISRRRELGLDSSWSHAFRVRNSPAIPAILAVGMMLVLIFLAWLLAAQALYVWFFGPAPPETFTGFLHEVLTTRRGWALLLTGNFVGLVFAVVVLSISSVAFPLLLERDCGVYMAIRTSARVISANPLPMLLWGLIVAALLVVGSIPLFVGLAVIIPVLGHSTWHLYRKTVDRP